MHRTKKPTFQMQNLMTEFTKALTGETSHRVNARSLD
jgi:hypothetical protein